MLRGLKSGGPRGAAVALLLSFLVLGAAYSVLTPSWEAPDEGGHFEHASKVVRSGLLVPRAGEIGETHQPPLYYILAGVATLPFDLGDHDGSAKQNQEFMWHHPGAQEVNAALHTTADVFPFRGQARALHLARLVSVLASLATVGMTVAIGWEIFPQHRPVGLVAGALVAFNPQFLFISGAVNNDSLVTMAATGTWWQLLRASRRPERVGPWAFTGLWVAIAILAKLSGLVAGAVAGLVLLGWTLQRRSARLLVAGTGSMLAAALAVSGWWFARNQLLYGDPLGSRIYPHWVASPRRDALDWGEIGQFLSTQYRSFWGVFGWMNVPAPDSYFMAVGVLMALAVLGLVLLAARRGPMDESVFCRCRTGALGVLLLAIVAQELFVVGVITQCDASCYQGRHLFPAIAPIMTLMALGLISALPRPLVAALAGILPAAAIAMLLVVVVPAYRVLPLETAVAHEDPSATRWEIDFEGRLRLIAYRLYPEVVAPGEEAVLSLYWQSGASADADFLAEVEVRDRFGNVWFSDASWMTLGAPEKPRDGSTTYETRRHFRAPSAVPVGRSPLSLAVRRATGGAPLPFRGPAGETEERAALQPVMVARTTVVERPEGTYPSPERFGPGVLLLGHTLSSEPVRAGERLGITLYWRASQALEEDFTVFVHLLDAQGRLVAQQDGQPNGGQYPTSTWLPGAVVRDERAVSLPRDLPPGRYSVLVGMYRWPSLQRLSAEREGVQTGDSVGIGNLTVGS